MLFSLNSKFSGKIELFLKCVKNQKKLSIELELMTLHILIYDWIKLTRSACPRPDQFQTADDRLGLVSVTCAN